MAAELMEMRRPVGVCTWVGRDVDDLAHVIMSEVEAEVADAGAGLDFRFEAPLSSAEMVARRVSDGRDGILQIISHAGEDGIMEVSDVWGSLSMTAENLARHLSGASVRVAVVVTCYGAKIAEALVQAKAVEVGVGMDMPLPFSVARAFSQGFYRGQTPVATSRPNGTRRGFQQSPGRTSSVRPAPVLVAAPPSRGDKVPPPCHG